MFTVRLLALVSLAWWFGFVAFVFPRVRSASAPDITFRQPARSAYLAVSILRNAEQFSSASVGFVGITPNEVIAWRAIAYGEDAENTLVQLVRSASPAGQLYALAGLRFRNEAAFAREARRFKNRSDQVSVASGCLVGSVSFKEILAQIERGEWIKGFVRGSD